MTHRNEDLLRQGYQARARGDVRAVLDLLADDIVWHVGGHNPLSGDYRGKQEVRALFDRFAEGSGGTLRGEPHDVLANDEHEVGLVEFSAEHEGTSLRARAVHIAHVRDGAITESWHFWEDQNAVDDFWS